MSPDRRTAVSQAKRIVLKLGTRVVTQDDGHVALARIFSIVEAAAGLRAAGRDVLLVSSGAVGMGTEALGFDSPPTELAERQACAAVGQSRLMGIYEQGFSRLGRTCAQVLLTQGDFENRLHYLNLRSTLMTLLRRGVIPMINENDAYLDRGAGLRRETSRSPSSATTTVSRRWSRASSTPICSSS